MKRKNESSETKLKAVQIRKEKKGHRKVEEEEKIVEGSENSVKLNWNMLSRAEKEKNLRDRKQLESISRIKREEKVSRKSWKMKVYIRGKRTETGKSKSLSKEFS